LMEDALNNHVHTKGGGSSSTRRRRRQQSSSSSSSFSPTHVPTVLLLDATSVAGQLLAEVFLLPSVLLAESTDLLRHVLGSPPPPPSSVRTTARTTWWRSSRSSSSRRTEPHPPVQPTHAPPPAVWHQSPHAPGPSTTTESSPLSSSSSSSWTLSSAPSPASSLSALSPGWWWWWWLWPSLVTRVTQRVTDAAQDRLTSLDLTSAFVALNRIRRSLDLPRLRTMADLWRRAPGAVLWVAAPEAVPWHAVLPNLVTFHGPFLPPCLPCEPTTTSKQDKTRKQWKNPLPPNHHRTEEESNERAATNNDSDNDVPMIILSAAFRRDDNTDRTIVRHVVRGLGLARESLQRFSSCPHGRRDRGSNQTEQNHNKSNLHSSSSAWMDQLPLENDDCWEGARDFRVVMLGPEHDVVLPWFIRHSRSSFMEALATHRPTWAMVSLCDNSNAWMVRTYVRACMHACVDRAF